MYNPWGGSGDVNFSETDFGTKNVYFNHVNFGKGNIDFSGAKFGKGHVWFGGGTKLKNGKVDFSYANFHKGKVIFDHFSFGPGDVYFIRANFCKGTLSFRYTDFNEGDVSFLEAIFNEGVVSFSDTNFVKTAVIEFTKANFDKSNVSFSKINFGMGTVFLDNIKINSDWMLKKVHAKKIDLSHSMIHGSLDFLGKETEISQLVLNETKLSGRIYIGSREIRLLNNLHQHNDAINCQEESTYLEKAYQFGLLKENFRNLGQYDDEDKAYLQFRRNELLHEAETLNKNWVFIYKNFKEKYPNIPKPLLQTFRQKKYFYSILFSLKKLIFQDIGHFGTNPKQIALYMCKTVVGFAGIYFLFFIIGWPVIHGNSVSELPWYKQIIFSAYHSIVTFLTIGYGDIQPANWFGILLSGIEGFLGLFLMSYFTVAFARKVLR